MKKSKNKQTNIPARIQKGSYKIKDGLDFLEIFDTLKEEFGFQDEDFKNVTISVEEDYKYCFYESDQPEIIVKAEWPDII